MRPCLCMALKSTNNTTSYAYDSMEPNKRNKCARCYVRSRHTSNVGTLSCCRWFSYMLFLFFFLFSVCDLFQCIAHQRSHRGWTEKSWQFLYYVPYTTREINETMEIENRPGLVGCGASWLHVTNVWIVFNDRMTFHLTINNNNNNCRYWCAIKFR